MEQRYSKFPQMRASVACAPGVHVGEKRLMKKAELHLGLPQGSSPSRSFSFSAAPSTWRSQQGPEQCGGRSGPHPGMSAGLWAGVGSWACAVCLLV